MEKMKGKKIQSRTKKKINARGIMKIISYDFDRMINDKKLHCEKIKIAIEKRLARLKDSDWEKVNWD